MDYLVLGNFLIDKNSKNGAFQTAHLNRPAILTPPLLVLRRFGLTIGSALAVLSALAFWRHRDTGWVFLVAAGIWILLGALFPKALRLTYEGWMVVARTFAWFTTRLLLTLLFFLVVTPIGFWQRLFGQQPIDLRFRTNDTTYWQRRNAGSAPADYEKQF